MKTYIKVIPVLMVLGAGVAHAELAVNSPEFQKCASNAECTLVTQNCSTNCPTLPINSAYEQSFLEQRNAMCGNDAASLLHCNVSPPLQPVCINNRCTVGYAFQNNADAKDMINGGLQPPTRQ